MYFGLKNLLDKLFFSNRQLQEKILCREKNDGIPQRSEIITVDKSILFHQQSGFEKHFVNLL